MKVYSIIYDIIINGEKWKKAFVFHPYPREFATKKKLFQSDSSNTFERPVNVLFRNDRPAKLSVRDIKNLCYWLQVEVNKRDLMKQSNGNFLFKSHWLETSLTCESVSLLGSGYHTTITQHLLGLQYTNLVHTMYMNNKCVLLFMYE